MGMSTRAHIQSLSSIGPILVKIFEVVERWVPVEVRVHDSIRVAAGNELQGVRVGSPYRFKEQNRTSRLLKVDIETTC